MILLQDYIDEMTRNVERVGYVESGMEMEKEKKKLNGGPKTREVMCAP